MEGATHSTHYIKRLYGVRHMVKENSDGDKGNQLPPHGLLFLISKGYLIYIIPDRITHTTAFVTPVIEQWLEREIGQWVRYEGSIPPPIAPTANALTTQLHLAPRKVSRSNQSCGFSRRWKIPSVAYLTPYETYSSVRWYYEGDA